MTTEITPRDKAVIIAEKLQGTPQSLANVLFHEGMSLGLENNVDFCAEIDQLVFECSECGWWCERSEESEHEEGVCTDCCKV